MSDLISRQAVRLIESDPNAYPQEWNDDYEKGFTDALNKVLALPSAHTVDSVPKWIPCSERLPAFGEDVLLSLGGRLHNVGFLVPTNEWKYSGWYHPFDDVIAWMPLPEPYEQKEQDDG